MPAVPMYKWTKEMDDMLLKFAEDNLYKIWELQDVIWISHTSLARMRWKWCFGINVWKRLKKLPIFKDYTFERYEG